MRLAIDARMMGAGNSRGIGRVTEELLKAMLEIAPEHEYVLIEKDVRKGAFCSHAGCEHVQANVHWYGLKEQVAIPRAIRQVKADLVLVPHWNVSWFCSIPRVVFIHDLILREEPVSANISTRGWFVRLMKRIGFRIILHRALFSSRAILVPTKHVAERIKHHYPSLRVPVHVVGEGMPMVNQSVWREPDRPLYLFMLGSAYPHKNHDLVFRAWPEIHRRYPELRLVIGGKKDAFMQKLEARVKQEKLEGISFCGEVPDQEIVSRMAGAFACVFPSRWEGFGLPPLEAMTAGIPVLSSDSSCMPEVLGEKGVIYFNPSSVDGIVGAVEALFRNPSGVRGDARMAAVDLALRHDWRKAAKRTLEICEKVIR